MVMNKGQYLKNVYKELKTHNAHQMMCINKIKSNLLHTLMTIL